MQPLIKNSRLTQKNELVMKHTKSLPFLIIVISFIWSCSDSASFETTHPMDGKVLNEIPSALRGKYTTEDDEILRVKRFSVADIYMADKDDGYALDSLHQDIEEEKLQIIEQTESSMTIQLDEEFIIDIDIEGDSAYFKFEIPDVIFSLNKEDILIQKNETYYFNAKDSDGHYQIRRVSFEGKRLVMENLVGADSVRTLLNIPQDSTLENLTITKEEFQRLEQVGFKRKKCYTKAIE